jgi:hypothetical protein
MKHSQLITLLHRQYAVAREIHCLLNTDTSAPMGWRPPFVGGHQPSLSSTCTRDTELMEALVSVQVVARLKAELEWTRRHQAGQAIHPEGGWQ